MHILYKMGQSFRWMRLLSLLLLPLAGRAQSTVPSTTVVISQIYGGGGNTGATFRSDYIELHNISAVSQTLAGYSVQYNSATGTGNYQVTALPASVTIPAGGYYLVQQATNGTATPVLSPAGDATGTINMSATAGRVALVNTTTALPATCTPNAAIIDFVGFGTANCFETAVAGSSTGNAFAFFRKDPTGTANTGCKETNDNSADFTTATPAPRSSTSTAVTCGAAPTAAEINVKQGTTTYLTGSTYSGFASTTIGNSDAKTFTIENLGGTVLNVSSIAATGDFSVSGAPTTVAANSTATFTVTFTPTAAGTRTGTLTINNDDADEATYVINLSASATATAPNPMIAVSQGGTAYPTTSTYSGFPNTLVGSTSAPVSFTITNSSTTDALTISGITTTGNFAVSGTVPTTVAANGGTATFSLTFSPTASGTRTGSVTIANNSQGTPSYVINLSGTGTVPAPTLTAIAPTNPVGGATYDFTLTGTDFGTIANTTVSFNGMSYVPASVNGGGTSLVVALPLPTAGGSFPTTVTTPNGTSNPLSLVVMAAPAGFFEPFEPGTQGSYPTTPTAVALRTGSYDFVQTLLNYPPLANDKFNNTQSARLRGAGSITMGFDKTGGAGIVTISAALYGSETGANLALEYSTDGGSTYTAAPGSPATLTGTLTDYAFTLNVAGAVRLRISTTNTTAGSNPRINVDDLRITNYTVATPMPTLAVTQGATSYPSNGTAYSFGNQTVNTTSSPIAFTLTNSGPDPLTISGITTTGDYAVSGTAPTTVPAGGTAPVSVTFTPTASGTRNGTLVITSNATNGATYTVNLTGTGQPAALPDLTVTTGTSTSPTPIAGNYNNVTIDPNAFAILVGPLTVEGALNIRPTGGLALNCQLLTGAGSFNLQDGGTLAICSAAGISPTGVPTGAVLLTGTRTYSPLANFIYNGTVAQVTGLGLPTTVLAVGVQNSANVTLSQALSLTQGLQLQAGNLNTGGFTFTLVSSATGTAGVVNIGGVVVGTTTVQRFINSSNPIGYRHYSAPVSNTTMADLTAPGFSPVFNAAYNSSATPGTVTPFPTVFGYDQDRIATVTSNFSSFDKGWFSPAGPTDPMVVGKGYTVNAPNTALIDFVGTLNNGPVPSGTLNRGTDFAAGWHLLGNPYPSPLDWSTVSPPQRPGMDAAIFVFESFGQYGGSYRASVNGVGGNGNSPQPIVVAGQGYFVRVATGQTSGQVNIDNPNRVTTFGPQPSFGRGTADLRPQVALTLQGAAVADIAHVYFQAGATTGKDVEFDATKLLNSHGLNLTSLGGSEALAINGLPALGAATVLVPLNVAAPQAGSYSLTATNVANLAGTTVTLVDALTSTRTVLAAGTTYAFTLAGTTAPGRFSLEFRPTGALATTPAQALAAQTQLFPNPASASFRVQLPVLSAKTAVQATLLNSLGQTVLRRSLSAAAGQAIDAEFDVRALAAGVYTLRLDVNGTPVTRKVVVE